MLNTQIKLILLIVTMGFHLDSGAQSLALSFDDGFNPSTQKHAAQWNADLLAHLAESQVKAVFYVTGSRIDSEEGINLVTDWGQQGHIISNHSYSHSNLNSNKITLKQFIVDVEKNERLLTTLPGWQKRFRFPYLKAGNTVEKRDGFRQWLMSHHYKPGAVSIDASDWYYNSRFSKWLKHNADQDPSVFRDAYLEHLWDRATYYEALSKTIFNRSSKHVLLLHTNRINAAFLPDIINMFRSKGWDIISPEEAYEDPLYSMNPDTLPAGESILWSLAKQKNIPDLRYPAEDAVYEKPILDSLGL